MSAAAGKLFGFVDLLATSTVNRLAVAEVPHCRTSDIATPDGALLALGRWLRDCGYRFTTVTPSTHKRVSTRPANPESATLRDIFGWSRPFQRSALPAPLRDLLEDAGALRASGGLFCSAVRYSTLGDQIFVHSSFPTEEADAVFFGPDTYRFARVVEQSVTSIGRRAPVHVLDVGAGSGAGGIHAAAYLHPASSIVLSDINRSALRFCRINAALNDVPATIVESDLFGAVEGVFDLIIANPPYLVDRLSRLYRHGGGQFGEGLSLKIAEQGLTHLAPGGRLVLYTGSSIVGGVDRLHEALRARLSDCSERFTFTYKEIDPDVFGEELEHPPYDQVDRIAVVVATIERLPERGHS